MARRRKLNKRVVVFLIIVGVVMVVGGMGLVLKMLPADAALLADRARKLTAEGEYEKAELDWRKAIGASKNDPTYCYELAKLLIEMADQEGVPESKRRERRAQARGLLQMAMRGAPDFVEAQRLLTDMSVGQTFLFESETLLQLVPDDHETYFNRAQIQSLLARDVPGIYTDKAIADYQKAIELKRDEPSYWMGLANFYRRLGREEATTKTFEEGIESNPDSPELRVAYADYLFRRDMKDEALTHIHEAIDRAPDSVSGHLALASFCLSDRELDKAYAALEAAKAADPSDFRVYHEIARIHASKKQYGQAADVIREGLAAITRRLTEADEEELSGLERRRLGLARVELQYKLADRLIDMIDRDSEQKDKLLPEITGLLEQIQQATPDGHHYSAKIAGRVALLEGRTDEAVTLLERADQGFRGTDLQVANMLVHIYMRDKPGKAEAILDRYLMMPQQQLNPSLLVAKATLETRYCNYEKAIELVERALRADPEHSGGKALRAQLQILTGEQKGLPEGVELSRRTVSNVLNRSMTLWMSEKRSEAIELVADLHRRLPDSLPIVQRLFNMYHLDGQIDKCKELLREVQVLYPDNEILKLQEKVLDEPDPEKRLQMRLKMTEEMSTDPLREALGKAMLYGQAGRMDEYLQQLQAASKIDPHNPSVVSGLFRYGINQQDWDIAEQAVQRATEANLDLVEGRLMAAQLAIFREEYDDAIRFLKDALQDHPESKRLQASLGECYLKAGNYTKSEELLSSVVEVDPGYAPGLIGMAKVTAALGRTEEHEDWIRRAYRVAPQDDYVRRAYLLAQERTSSPEEVIEKRERILERNPDDLENRFRLGMLYTRIKQPDKAEQMIRYIWEHSESNKVASARLLVGLYASLGRYADGIEVLNELLTQTDDKVMVYVMWAEFLADYDAEQAENALKKAIESDPSDRRGYLAMARHMEKGGRWGDAVQAMEKYLEIAPDSPARQKDLVTYLIRAKQFERGEKLLEKILEEDPSDARGLMLRGLLSIERKETDEGLNYLTQAIEQDPRLADALYHRARVYRFEGRINDARRDLQNARALSDAPRVAMDLASVMLSLGDRTGAQLLYSEILRDRPDYRPAIAQLLELYLRQDRWELMESLLAQAQSRFPSDPTYPIFEARMWLTRRQDALAIEALERALKISSNYIPALRMYLAALIESEQYDRVKAVLEVYKDDPVFAAWVNTYQARALVKQGKTPEADEVFLASLKQVRKDQIPLVVDQLATAYGLEKAGQKLASWMPALGEQEWRIHWQLGVIHLRQRNMQNALDSLLKAREHTDSNTARATVNRDLGMTYWLMGKLPEAEAAYLAVLKVLPEDVMAMNDLAYMYVDQLDRPDEAVPYARKAAAAMPTDGSVADTLGWSLAKSGRLEEALEQLSRSVQLGPGVPDARYHLGWVYERLGRDKEAEIQYRQGFEMIRDNTAHPLHAVMSKALADVREKISSEEP